MIVQHEDMSIDTIGDLSSDTISLKLLYPGRYEGSPADKTWDLMWRNCYRIPAGISVDNLEINIYKGLAGTEGNPDNDDSQDGTAYLKILGLDQYDLTDRKLPDGLVDDRIEIFRPELGLLILPHRSPFNSDTTFTDDNGITTPELAEKIPQIYDYNSITEKVVASKYYFKLKILMDY